MTCEFKKIKMVYIYFFKSPNFNATHLYLRIVEPLYTKFTAKPKKVNKS